MRVGSLFSGIGGIELGLERAGFETAWFVEYEPYAQAVLRKHWPATPIYGDITQLNFNELPQIDVLTGGFPCQDISKAGKRIGITGSRSGLWKYYAEAIRILRPKIIIAENVAALIDRGLNVVLADLASLGYDAEWYCVSAASVGARHRRDRVFVLAYNSGQRCMDGESQEHAGERRFSTFLEAFSSGEDVANSDSERLERQRVASSTPDETITGGGTYWEVEPELDRVANGVPDRVDRIRCLGNAVVPQVAQAIGEAIMICAHNGDNQNVSEEKK